MSLKSLPFRAPASKVLPRKRTVGERIVAALEFAALVRTISRVLGRRKRRRLPTRRGLLALAGGGLLAAIAGVVLAKRKSVDPEPPPASAAPAPGAVTGGSDDAAQGEVRVADPVPAAVAATGQVNATGADAPNEGATGEHPTEEEKA
jgi:hypothetical protein